MEKEDFDDDGDGIHFSVKLLFQTKAKIVEQESIAPNEATEVNMISASNLATIMVPTAREWTCYFFPRDVSDELLPLYDSEHTLHLVLEASLLSLPHYKI